MRRRVVSIPDHKTGHGRKRYISELRESEHVQAPASWPRRTTHKRVRDGQK